MVRANVVLSNAVLRKKFKITFHGVGDLESEVLVPLCPAGGYRTGLCSTTLDRSYRRKVYTSIVGERCAVTIEMPD